EYYVESHAGDDRRSAVGKASEVGDRCLCASAHMCQASYDAVWYIAHADVETITVVDLAGGTVLRQTAVQSHTSVIGRIAGWLMPSVAAKGGPTTDRWATLSTDGTHLFVIGQQSVPTQSADNQRQISTTSTGLQVIDTETLHEVRRLDLPANAMMLSPNGHQLLLNTFDDRVDRTHTLVILDTERLTELGRRDFDAAFMLDGFSRDGRYAYLHQTANAGGDHVTVRVFDLQAQRVVVERVLDGYIADVLAPRSDPTH
ncbi:MAG: YncE family protein, partial [Thermomicrobiales bacterium]